MGTRYVARRRRTGVRGLSSSSTTGGKTEEPGQTLCRDDERELEELSPFEVKARLLELAGESARSRNARVLDAGRGNPNWVATTPRAAFFLLGEFGLAESRRVWEEPDLGGMPARDGIAGRLDEFLAANNDRDGAALLQGHDQVRRVAGLRHRTTSSTS